ncbi:hypothetical protein HDU89_007372, partial [Geranomyces variabilis]
MTAKTTIALHMRAFPLFITLLLAALATSASPANALTINCSGFYVDNTCYTDPRLKACVLAQAPNWPFTGPARQPGASRPACPSPVDDPMGFSACMDANSPHSLPNASAVVQGCVASTGVTGSITSAALTAWQGGGIMTAAVVS